MVKQNKRNEGLHSKFVVDLEDTPLAVLFLQG